MQAEDKDREHHRLAILIRHGGQVGEDHHQDRVHHRHLGILTKRGNSHHRLGRQDRQPAVEVEEEVTGDHPITKTTTMAITTILAAMETGRATDLQNFTSSPANDQIKPAKSAMTTGSRSYISSWSLIQKPP